MQAGAYFEMLRTCPVTTVCELTRGHPLVVLSPHPDDETLGAGGLIAEACGQNQEVEVVVVTDGSGSHPRSTSYPRERLVELRYSEVQEAGSALGLKSDHLQFLGLTDTMVPKSGPRFDTAVAQALTVIRRSGAASLFVTWAGDPHCDHEATAELAKAVRRLCPGLMLWAYPIWGWHLEANHETGQPPPKAFRIDVSRHQKRKQAAISAHASQMTDLIDDDPDGFRFDGNLLAPFLGQFEYFIEVPN